MTGYITNVSTDSFAMGKGVATTLIGMCIEYARRNNFSSIFLEVMKENLNTLEFYKKLNFQEFEDKLESVTMKYIV